MANPDGVVTEADVRAAQSILDGLTEWGPLEPALEVLPAGQRLELRGHLASWSADVRTSGYLEGVQRGRQEAAHVILDALQGEGLAPMPTSRPEAGW